MRPTVIDRGAPAKNLGASKSKPVGAGTSAAKSTGGTSKTAASTPTAGNAKPKPKPKPGAKPASAARATAGGNAAAGPKPAQKGKTPPRAKSAPGPKSAGAKTVGGTSAGSVKSAAKTAPVTSKAASKSSSPAEASPSGATSPAAAKGQKKPTKKTSAPKSAGTGAVAKSAPGAAKTAPRAPKVSPPKPALPGQPVSAARASTSATFAEPRTLLAPEKKVQDPGTHREAGGPADRNGEEFVPFWTDDRPTGETKTKAKTKRPQSLRRAALLSGRRGVVVSLVPIAALVGLLGVSGVIAVTGAPQAPISAVALPSSQQAAALGWMDDNLGAGARVLVEQAVADLLPRGLGGVDSRLVEDISGGTTGGWRDLDVVIATPSVRDIAATTPDVGAALANSVVLAEFGTGDQRIEIRRVAPQGATLAAAAESTAAAQRREFGAELSRNPSVVMSTPDRVAFAGGDVDPRVSVVLGALAGGGQVAVSGLPVIVGEEGVPHRQVALTSLGGEPLVVDGEASAEAVGLFEGLGGTYALKSMTVDGTALVLTFPLISRDTPE